MTTIINNEKENSNYLKPCPFCGCDQTECETVEINTGCSIVKSFRCVCFLCGAATALDVSEEAAVKAWNRRTNNSC